MKKIKETESASLFRQLEQIGINGNLGLKNCNGEKDFYLEMLQTYCGQKEENCKTIKKLYEDSNWPGYTAKVHALKSVSRTIGAEHFSRQAEKMEQAGKARNTAYIKECHCHLLWEYENICSRLSSIHSDQMNL